MPCKEGNDSSSQQATTHKTFLKPFIEESRGRAQMLILNLWEQELEFLLHFLQVLCSHFQHTSHLKALGPIDAWLSEGEFVPQIQVF